MDKVDHISPLESDGLAKKEEEEVIQDVGSDQKEEEDLDMILEIGEDIEDEVLEEDDEEEDDEEEENSDDVYKDLLLHPKVTSWVSPVSGKTNHGIQVMDVPLSTMGKRYDFDLCPICCEPWTLDKVHQMSCLPCGHIFGMSCLKEWMGSCSSDRCPQCYQDFSLESIRLLYVTRLFIPAAADPGRSFVWFSFNKIGLATFKQYERERRTDALKNRSNVLKQRALVSGRQNDAMKRRTELLNRMADTQKRVDVLERQNNAIKQKLLNRMTDEEEWVEASEHQADVEKRVESVRRKASALGKWADEYLRKADAFGRQAKSLRQQAKSLGQLVDSYRACRKFYIQSFSEFMGLHDNKITK